jgi:hypothetical protein
MNGIIKSMAHFKMRRVAIAVLAVALSGIRAFPPQASAAPPAGAAELGAILDAWVQQSSRIKSLAVKFTRSEHRPPWGAPPPWGRIEFLYEVRWKDSGQAVLNLEQVVAKDKKELFERIVWTGREVWDYNPRKKEISVQLMDQLGEYEVFRAWLKQSGWGRWIGHRFDWIFPTLSDPKAVDPLPFLLGVKETLAKHQFQFERLADPNPRQILLRATPLTPDLKSSYNDILITLDRERSLPISLLYRRGLTGKDTRQFTLHEIMLNPSIADSTFEPRKPRGWEIKRPTR